MKSSAVGAAGFVSGLTTALPFGGGRAAGVVIPPTTPPTTPEIGASDTDLLDAMFELVFGAVPDAPPISLTSARKSLLADASVLARIRFELRPGLRATKRLLACTSGIGSALTPRCPISC